MKDKVMCPRTDYLILGEKKCFIFVGAQESREAPSRIACIQTTDGGLSFDFVSWVTPANADFRAIMSQTVQTGENEFVLAYRKIYRSDTTYDTIEAYRSTDGCKSGSSQHGQDDEEQFQPSGFGENAGWQALLRVRRPECRGDSGTVHEDGGATWGPSSSSATI
jgi:hypothetical protein